MRATGFRRSILDVLRAPGQDETVDQLLDLPPHRVIRALLSLLCGGDDGVRWLAVTAIGRVVSRLAGQDMEAARVVMRRLMWSLNDESGGIGWGAPEAMAEVMACHEGLAREYAHILVSYCRRDGNFLEYEPLQRGALLGLARLAQERPGLIDAQGVAPHLCPFLASSDVESRGLAAWALKALGAAACEGELERLLSDDNRIELHLAGEVTVRRVGDLAAEALEAARRARPR